MTINFVETFEEFVEEDFKKRAQELEDYIIVECPVDTGAMRDSIHSERIATYEYLIGVDADQLASDNRNKANIDYSPFVYNGVNHPVTIYPRRAMYLHWVDKYGIDRFASKVTIPPRKANKFLDRAINRMGE